MYWETNNIPSPVNLAHGKITEKDHCYYLTFESTNSFTNVTETSKFLKLFGFQKYSSFDDIKINKSFEKLNSYSGTIDIYGNVDLSRDSRINQTKTGSAKLVYKTEFITPKTHALIRLFREFANEDCFKTEIADWPSACYVIGAIFFICASVLTLLNAFKVVDFPFFAIFVWFIVSVGLCWPVIPFIIKFLINKIRKSLFIKKVKRTARKS